MAEGPTGKVALITGAGSGIGRAMAVLFTREGACAAAGDLNAQDNAETIRLIEEHGGISRFAKPSGSLLVPLMIWTQKNVLISLNCAERAPGWLHYTHSFRRLGRSCASEKDIA